MARIIILKNINSIIPENERFETNSSCFLTPKKLMDVTAISSPFDDDVVNESCVYFNHKQIMWLIISMCSYTE